MNKKEIAFKENDLAYCGLYCPECSFLVADETGEEEHINQMPARYDRFKGQGAHVAPCKNCKSDACTCGDCPMQDCARERGYVSCADCPAFPCAHNIAFENDGTPHHAQAIKNLREIHAHGVEKWFQSVRERLFCSCGQRQSWYYSCPKHAEK